jgi:hypothetical protein
LALVQKTAFLPLPPVKPIGFTLGSKAIETMMPGRFPDLSLIIKS